MIKSVIKPNLRSQKNPRFLFLIESILYQCEFRTICSFSQITRMSFSKNYCDKNVSKFKAWSINKETVRI